MPRHDVHQLARFAVVVDEDALVHDRVRRGRQRLRRPTRRWRSRQASVRLATNVISGLSEPELNPGPCRAGRGTSCRRSWLRSRARDRARSGARSTRGWSARGATGAARDPTARLDAWRGQLGHGLVRVTDGALGQRQARHILPAHAHRRRPALLRVCESELSDATAVTVDIRADADERLLDHRAFCRGEQPALLERRRARM